jgi:tetratricopeptide (TPR) repeat protein
VSSAPIPGTAERSFGLLLFDAEESLARGEAEKAMVLASRAVKERPDNFTARSLLERARRELLRGRRREKLEARIVEARALVDAGSYEAAEKIVNSALKLIPDHEGALALFTRLRDRPRASAAESEAERELERLGRAQAEKALEAARAAEASGQFRRALSLLRRGLRQAPDHPELLAVLRRAQATQESLDADRARRRALAAQVRAGLELLAAGRLPESLRLLRAVLDEDPDNARAQAAIQELRRAYLARRTPLRPEVPAPAARVAAEAAPPAPAPARAPITPAASPARGRIEEPATRGVPVEILLPRTRRQGTPLPWILGGSAAILLVLALLAVSGRAGRPPAPSVPAPEARLPEPPPTTAPAAPGPLDALDPELRAAVESTLARYAQALEAADAERLAQARPDLGAEARERRLRPYRGALNAAADLRVIDARVLPARAEVDLLSTDIVVGGQAAPASSLPETLVFERTPSGWALRAR